MQVFILFCLFFSDGIHLFLSNWDFLRDFILFLAFIENNFICGVCLIFYIRLNLQSWNIWVFHFYYWRHFYLIIASFYITISSITNILKFMTSILSCTYPLVCDCMGVQILYCIWRPLIFYFFNLRRHVEWLVFRFVII